MQLDLKDLYGCLEAGDLALGLWGAGGGLKGWELVLVFGKEGLQLGWIGRRLIGVGGL